MDNELINILLDGDYYLNVNGVSKHLNTDIKYNEKNPGLGLMAVKDGKFLTAGGYKNSFSDPSYYVGGGVKKRYGSKDAYIEPGLIGGLVTGYDQKLTPMLMPMLSAGSNDYGALNLMYAPKVENQNPATLMINYSIPIK